VNETERLSWPFSLQSESLVNQPSLPNRLGFLSGQDSSAVFLVDSALIEPKIIETERLLNALIRSLQTT